MASLLSSNGLSVSVGEYSIRVVDCEHFVFQEYGGDMGEPAIDADASSLDAMMRDGERVSKSLALAGIRHRFVVYDLNDVIVAYYHHAWPQEEKAK
ncbi:MAG: hypothetical protein U0894_18565 [Pirellulales bacterium]